MCGWVWCHTFCVNLCPLIDLLGTMHSFSDDESSKPLEAAQGRQLLVESGTWGVSPYEWRKEDWDMVVENGKREACVIIGCE